MCTAFSWKAMDHYFGRNLDLDYHYDETVTLTPRAFPLPFRHKEAINHHFAIIGIATVVDGYPLYYDAMNEKGLCMAGLNFPGNAVYQKPKQALENIASFELIPWILSQCESVAATKQLLLKTNVCDCAFCKDFPPTPLHWIVSDSKGSITVEPRNDGLAIIDNQIGVLTNNPPFEYHMHNLSNYMHLSPKTPHNAVTPSITLEPYSLGMGGIGLPGDFSSASRFIRCAFVKEHTRFGESESDRITQVFHILSAVAQFDGCVQTQRGYEKTIYSICCNATKGYFYYTTYNNRQITGIDMRKENLCSADLISYPLRLAQQICFEKQKGI